MFGILICDFGLFEKYGLFFGNLFFFFVGGKKYWGMF